MKIKRLIFSIIGAAILGAMLFTQSVYANTPVTISKWFNVYKNVESGNDIGTGNADYYINNGTITRRVLNFIEYPNYDGQNESTASNYNWVDAYCARANKGFETNGTFTPAITKYDKQYTLNTDKENLKNQDILATFDNQGHDLTISYGNKTANTYDAILALADLMYTDEASNMEDVINKACKYYATNGENVPNMISEAAMSQNPYNYFSNINGNNYVIDKQQLRAAQQAALWTFTNHNETGYDVRTINDWLLFQTSNNGQKMTVSSISGRGEFQSKQAEAIYFYLVNSAITNASNTNYTPKNTVYLYTNSANTNQPIIVITPHKKFDVALRKFITKIEDSNGTERTGTNYNYTAREPKITDAEKTKLANGNATFEKADSNKEVKGTTAAKKHEKTPLEVQKGDKVYYTIRVYNEGEVAGKVKVTDYLPEGLSFAGDTTKWTTTTENGKTKITSKNYVDLAAFSTEANNTAWYKDFTVTCTVNSDATSGNLKNVAEISEAKDSNGNDIEDIDSTPNNLGDKSNYKNYNPGSDRSTNGIGYEDDDDYENLKIVQFDLALRKYITSYTPKNGTKVTIEGTDKTRTPNVDPSTIPDTATYKHRKQPVIVTKGATVNYKLTVYNEGDIDGRADVIKDQLPTGLTFDTVVSGEFTGVEQNGVLTLTRNAGSTKTLSKFVGRTTPDSETIEIQCKVAENLDNTQDDVILTNIAWIARDSQMSSDTATSTDRDSQPTVHPQGNELVTYGNNIGYIGNRSNSNLDLNSKDSYFKGEQDDDDFEKIKIIKPEFDLKLLKRITAVNDKEVKNRITSVDVTPLVDGTDTTAIYKMEKDPVKVKKGDIVTYTLRIYNEGEVDGYASELTEDVPEGLEFISDNETNTKYGWTEKTVEGKKVLVTNYLDKQPNDSDDKNLIKAFDKTKAYSDTENSKNPDYREVKIALKVVSTKTSDVIRNEAEISDDKDKEGREVTDRDSTPEEWKKEEDKDKDYDNRGKWHPYKEDDEDYDNIELEIFDLSLRKFITKVGKDESMKDATQYQRAPQVDTSKLNKDGNTTAIYNHPKEPVQVNVGDYVEYTLRVYNEGTADGYAAEIKDHLPVYLEYVDGEFNKAYGWHAEKENGRTVIVTDYLKNTLLKATKTDANGKITLDSSENHELKILCRVVTTAPLKTKITNIADISKYEDSDHNEVEDRDSQEDNVNVPAEKDLPSYKDDETGSYIPGQQDDDDFEKVITPEIFDLALRKFITKIEDKEVTTRVPKVEYKDNKITYTHPKDALDVINGNVVTYTLRIFNEGEINGYASVITDDIPKGVQFIPDNKINKEYRWVMYEEAEDQSIKVDGKDVVECKVKGNSEVKKYKVTNDVTKAVIVRTDYLSKEQGEARMKKDSSITKNPNLLKAFDKEAGISDTNPDYKDIQVAFKVTEKNGSKKIITNYAQISDDTDEFGNEVEDIDSTPDKWNEGEDDQDIENIKLPLFDLALRKWVTQAIVIENGKTTVTKTGHDAWDDPEGIVKVELHRKKLSNVTVKFRYSIRVYNQGEIEGYAKEITDYIPQGLKFIAKDNPQWKDKGNNVITTDQLKNTLLKPGESADVEVLLTWVNDKNNMGLKVNTAEISKDYNEKGVPDKDSTPNNKKPGEDDIDDAPVMLSVSTGSEITYYALGLGVLIVIAGGIFLIKKYVL